MKNEKLHILKGENKQNLYRDQRAYLGFHELLFA